MTDESGKDYLQVRIKIGSKMEERPFTCHLMEKISEMVYENTEYKMVLHENRKYGDHHEHTLEFRDRTDTDFESIYKQLEKKENKK